MESVCISRLPSPPYKTLARWPLSPPSTSEHDAPSFGRSSLRSCGCLYVQRVARRRSVPSERMARSARKKLQVVAMAPEEEKLTRRNPLDFPIEWERPKPGRRPDIFPKFSPMKTPLPPPMPYDPPEEDEEEEEEKKEEEEEDPEKEEDEQPEKQK